MILVDNRNILRLKNRELLNRLSQLEGRSNESFKVKIEDTKAGIPTLKINVNDKTQYIHSKYDPEKEAERLISQLDGLETANHILFFGSGLGYHIKKFTEKYPNKKFSIFEPNEEVLINYLSNQELNDLPINNLDKILSSIDESKVLEELMILLGKSHNMLRLYVLPVYEQLYSNLLKKIRQKMLEQVKDKRSEIGTSLSFQKRWTINSIKNFPTVLQTPNILHDIDKSVFEGKPAIIVAAGPSLNEEFENLRYISENGLAYIFSVGSAINALIKHGIYPNATCTYDPQDINYRVIQIIKDRGINTIPLVFGSSVGHETLEKYPGKMLHMLVSQDTISPAFLGENLTTNLSYVNDAPSIAVVTYQLLAQLGFSKIILVGQNLAYIGKDHYAQGIDYGNGTVASKTNLENAIEIIDVNGNTIKTSEGFNKMRRQLEAYIKSYPSISTINTTKNGASIVGTNYMPLKQVIKEELTSDILLNNWYEAYNNYDLERVQNNIIVFNNSQIELKSHLEQSLQILKQLNQNVERRILKNIETLYSKFDISFDRIKENYYYRIFIEPMIRVQNENLSKQIQSVRYEKNEFEKGKTIIGAFKLYLNDIANHYNFTTQLYEDMKEKLEITFK